MDFVEKENLKCMREIAGELKRIRQILERDKAPTKIVFDKDGTVTLVPDVMEDDLK